MKERSCTLHVLNRTGLFKSKAQDPCAEVRSVECKVVIVCRSPPREISPGRILYIASENRRCQKYQEDRNVQCAVQGSQTLMKKHRLTLFLLEKVKESLLTSSHCLFAMEGPFGDSTLLLV